MKYIVQYFHSPAITNLIILKISNSLKKYILSFFILIIPIRNQINGTTSEGISGVGMLTSIPTATLSFLSDGPKTDSIIVPTNGKGYAYFLFKSDYDVNITIDETFIIELELPNSEIYYAYGDFPADTLLRIAVDNNFYLVSQYLSFSTPQIINTEGGKFCIKEPKTVFVKKEKPVFQRTWDIFAGGSAGLSGLFGSIGAGASVSAAKISVKGVAGIGFQIQLDEKGNMFLDRRIKAGGDLSFQCPSINLVVDQININAGPSANILTEILMGHRFLFTDLTMDDNIKKIAQAGLVLETLSLAAVGLSPSKGAVIRAIIATLNNQSGVDQTFESAKIAEYKGLGFEGKLSTGLSAALGPINLQSYSASAAYAFSGKLSSIKRKINPISKSQYSITNIGSNISITQAMAFNFSLYSLGFNLNDNVELSSGNFTLFGAGAGGELALGADLDNSNNLSQFSVSLKGGYDVTLFGDSRKDYYNTKIEFPKEYKSLIVDAGKGIAGLFTSAIKMPLGTQLIADAVSSLNLAIEKHINNKPIKITTLETKGQGFDLGLGFSLDAAFGVGLGLLLGGTIKYFDEIEYPRKYSEIYSLRKKYLLHSSEYINEMGEANLGDILNELLTGTELLIVDALKDECPMIERYYREYQLFKFGMGFLPEILTGQIEGILDRNGTCRILTFSPNSPMSWQRAFEEPKVRQMYYSPYVKHKVLKSSEDSLADVSTTLVLVSDCMHLSFIHDGSSEILDSLNSPITIKMLINEEKLLENEFTMDDKERVQLYRYDNSTLSWVLEGGSINNDTIYTDITYLGTYALGIELTDSDDLTAPSILEWGPVDGSTHDTYPEIYGIIKDNKYGVGVSLMNSHIMLNGDTLNISYDPSLNKIYYKLSELDSLENMMMNVTIVATDLNMNSTEISFAFNLDVEVGVNEESIPNEYILYQNYPNPFNPSTTISFEIPEETEVTINIYDVQGRFIRRIIKHELKTGLHYTIWDGNNSLGHRVTSGIYFYQLKTNKINVVKKMQLLK